MAKPRLNIDLRAVVYRDGEFWCAHCLELDLVASGSTVARAVRDLIVASEIQIQDGIDDHDLAAALRPAPAEYWRMYFAGRSARFKVKPARPISRFEIREMAA